MFGRAIILSLGVAGALIYAPFFFGKVLISVDTTTYWQWHPWVPLGYPLFMSAVDETIGLRWAGLIQILLLVASITFLGMAVRRMAGWPFGALVTILLLSYTPVFAIQGALWSESIYFPLLLANVGCALYLVAGHSRAAAIGMAVTAALMIFVRPAGLFVLCGVVFLLLANMKQWRWMLTWLVLPLILSLLTTSAINYAVRGNAAQSQFGRVLFPHVAFIYEPDKSCFGAAVESVMQKRRAAYLASENRAIFSMQDYNRRLDELDAALFARCPNINAASAYLAASISTIRSHPVAFQSLISDGILEAWSHSTIMASWGYFNDIYKLNTVDYAPRYRAMLEAFKLPLSVESITLRPELTAEIPAQIIAGIENIRLEIARARWFIILVGIASLLAIPIGLIRPRLAALGYCGVLIHGSVLLTVTTTVFIPRYAMPVDTILLVAGVLAIAIARRQIPLFAMRVDAPNVPPEITPVFKTLPSMKP